MDIDPKVLSTLSTIFGMGLGYGYVKFTARANATAIRDLKKHVSDLLTFKNIFNERIKEDTISKIWEELQDRAEKDAAETSEHGQMRREIDRLNKKVFNGGG